MELVSSQKTRLGSFLHGITEEDWGQRTMRFFDPDRHLIEIGEPMNAFISRMYHSGLNENEISQKSNVPIETVRDLLSQE